jgi:PmbA protein
VSRYAKLARELVAKAKRRGADAAEAFLQVGRESSVSVRDGQVEDLTQATSKGVGLRVFVKGRLGFAFTSDFDPAALSSFVDRAVELARTSAPDRLNGLPDRALLKGRQQPEGLFDPAVANLPADWKLKAALEVERAGRAVDPRITTFDSVGAGDYVSEVHVASTEGLSGSYEGTYVFLYAVPVASAEGQLQTAHRVDYKRHLADLESPEAVGREAALRAVRMLGARKVRSQRVPVVFDPQVAASFVGNLVAAANGDAVYKKASVFAGRLGEQLAPEGFTVVDDGLLRRGLGSSPFDGEGLPTRRTPLIERGVLRHFLYDAYTARKAKALPTGNASRGYSSLPHIGAHNLYLEPGPLAPADLLRGVKQGLYVTSMLGSGANPVTGDYSRGANGLWIEDGELAYPVQEITVAGNLLQMLRDVDGVGNDLQFRSSVASPSLRFRELTVSGT